MVKTRDRLPKDLIGGWEFKETFNMVALSKNQVWRKCGPINAIKIIRVMITGHLEYDGAMQGISIKCSKFGKTGIVWGCLTWFKLGNEKQILSWLKKNNYALAVKL